jgi:hypothetical protein
MDSGMRKAILDQAKEQADVIQAEVDRLLAELEAISPEELKSRAVEMRDRMIALIRRQGELGERMCRTVAALNTHPSRAKH